MTSRDEPSEPFQEAGQAETTISAGRDKREEPLKVEGPIRRNLWLFLVVALTLVVGPSVTRFIQSYRAIVLEVRDDEMFLAWEQRPPKWVAAIDTQPGSIVAKEVGDWDPKVVEAKAYDAALRDLYARYTRVYRGVIVRINPPVVPSGPSTAVIELEGGGTLHLPLESLHMAAAAVGRRVEKRSGTWEPVLVDEIDEDKRVGELGRAPAGAVSPTPTAE